MFILGFNPEKYFLGKLCKHNHNWQETQQSLRNLRNKSCYECCKLATQRWRQRNPEKVKEYAKAHWQQNPRSRPAEYYRQYYQSNPESAKQAKKRYKEKNLEKFLASGRKYSMRTWKEQYLKRYPKIKIYRRQRQHKIKGLQVSPYSPQDLIDRLQLFGNKCAYCEKNFEGGLKLHWDHVVPIASNGHDALYNLVPACHHCNCQKWKTDAFEWYYRQPFFNQSRWDLISEICSNRGRTPEKPQEKRE